MEKKIEKFSFFRSYFLAIKGRSNKVRLELYDAMCLYAFTGEIVEDLSDEAQSLFYLILPNIQSSIKKQGGGAPKENANAKKQKQNNIVVQKTDNIVDSKQNNIVVQKGAKTKQHSCIKNEQHSCLETEQKQNNIPLPIGIGIGVGIGNKDKDNNNPPLPPLGGYAPPDGGAVEIKKKTKDFDLDFLDVEWREVVSEWLNYKRQRKESYKSSQSVKALYTKLCNLAGGDIAVAKQIIEQSMANNWAGIFPLKTEKDYGTTSYTRPKGEDVLHNGADFTKPENQINIL